MTVSPDFYSTITPPPRTANTSRAVITIKAAKRIVATVIPASTSAHGIVRAEWQATGGDSAEHSKRWRWNQITLTGHRDLSARLMFGEQYLTSELFELPATSV